MTIRYGDTIAALPGTPTAIFADGRTGTVVETPVNGRGLVRWDGDPILMGFHSEYVRVVPA